MSSPGGLARLRGDELRLSLMGHGAPIVRYEVDVGDARFPSSARKRTSTAPALSLITRPLEHDQYSPDIAQIASPYDATSPTFPFQQHLPTSQSMELPSSSDSNLALAQREISFTPRRSRRHSLNGPKADEIIRAPIKLKRKAVPRLNTRDGEDLRMVSADSQGRLRVLEPSTSMMTSSSSGALTSSSSGPMLSMGQSSSSGSIWSSSLETPMMQGTLIRGLDGDHQVIGSPDVFASPTNDESFPTYPFSSRSESGGFSAGPKDKSNARLMRSGQVWNLAQLDLGAAARSTESSEQSPKSLHPLLSPTFIPIPSSTPTSRHKSPSSHNASPSEFKLTPPPPPHDEMVSEAPGSPSPSRNEKRRPSSLIADRSLTSVDEGTDSLEGRESFEGESFYALQKFTPSGSPSSRQTQGDGYFQSRKGSAASGQVGSPLARYARNDSQDLQGVFAAHIGPARPTFLDALKAMEDRPDGEPHGLKAISFAKSLRSKLSRDNLMGENTSLRAKPSKENLRGEGRTLLSKVSRDDLMVQGGFRGLRQTRSKDNLLSMGGAGFLGTKRSRDDLRAKNNARPIISHPLASEHRRSRSIPVVSLPRDGFLDPGAEDGRPPPQSSHRPFDVDVGHRGTDPLGARDGMRAKVEAESALPRDPGYRPPAAWTSLPAKLNRSLLQSSTPPSPLRSVLARDRSEVMDVTTTTTPALASEPSAEEAFSPRPSLSDTSRGLSKRSVFSTPHSLHTLAAAPGHRTSIDEEDLSSSSADSIDRLQDVTTRENAAVMTEPKLASFDAGHPYSLRLESTSPQRRSFRPAIEQRPSTSGSSKSLTAPAFQARRTKDRQDPRRLSVTVTPGPRKSEDSTFAASSSVNTLEGFEISAESLQELAYETAHSASIAQFQAAPPAFHFPSPPPSERPFSTASMQDRAQAVMLRFPSPPPGESADEQKEDASRSRDASRYIDGRRPGKMHHLSMMSVLEHASSSEDGAIPSVKLTTAALAAHDAGMDEMSETSVTNEIDRDAQALNDDVMPPSFERPNHDDQSRWSQAATAQETVGGPLATPLTPRIMAAKAPTTPERMMDYTPQIAIESPHGTRYRNTSATSDLVVGLTVQSYTSPTQAAPPQHIVSQDPLARVKGFPTTFSSYDTSPKSRSSPSFSPRSNPMQSPLQDARAQYKPIAPLSVRTKGEDMRLRPLQQMTDDGMLSAKSTTSFGLSSSSQSSLGDELSERYAVNETWRDVVCGCFGRLRTYKP